MDIDFNTWRYTNPRCDVINVDTNGLALYILVSIYAYFGKQWIFKRNAGLFPAILRKKAPGQNWEKMIDFTFKLGEINDIEHNTGSKIYPQN